MDWTMLSRLTSQVIGSSPGPPSLMTMSALAMPIGESSVLIRYPIVMGMAQCGYDFFTHLTHTYGVHVVVDRLA